jgi:hypothetical protein
MRVLYSTTTFAVVVPREDAAAVVRQFTRATPKKRGGGQNKMSFDV